MRSHLRGCIDKEVLLPHCQDIVAATDTLDRISEFSNRTTAAVQDTVVDLNALHASKERFSNLRLISIADLRLHKRHGGRRFEGVVCCPATRRNAVQLLLEDVQNASHAIKVSLYNLVPDRARVSQVRCLLPEGTRIAIKAPYYIVYLARLAYV